MADYVIEVYDLNRVALFKELKLSSYHQLRTITSAIHAARRSLVYALDNECTRPDPFHSFTQGKVSSLHRKFLVQHVTSLGINWST